ncbi:trypsin-1-like [Lutzomyia longipalpis]|uniref:trypsin-1-like n=1 Tax=Lutzomyia longipalpis TaxID=7200 RepID=UPI00248434B1|nr:trypsin-1-like [Lutzomyia longipalpis]
MKGILVFAAFAASSILSIPLAPNHFHKLMDFQQEFPRNNITALQPRIINGSPAAPGTFQYQVEITIYGLLLSAFLLIGWCGGSIISETWVLTAAQCVNRDPSLQNPLPFIVVGFSIETRSGQETSISLNDAHVHPLYDSDTRAYDFALLHTETLIYNANTGSIALPPASTVLDTYVNDVVIASGYGPTTNTQTGTPSSTLMWIQLQGITRAQCQAAYGSRFIPFSSFCAVDTTAPIGSTCSYDSGGPLTLTESGSTTLIGVISFTHPTGGCNGSPQGFANVAFAIPWITTTRNAFPN